MPGNDIVGSAATPNVDATNLSQSTNLNNKEGPTALQLGIMMVVLGASAGFTLYTRKTSSMLQTMNKITENQLRNRPPKFGPPTKQEWEKLRPKFDKDEFV